MYAEHWRKMGNFPILLVQSSSIDIEVIRTVFVFRFFMKDFKYKKTQTKASK